MLVKSGRTSLSLSGVSLVQSGSDRLLEVDQGRDKGGRGGGGRGEGGGGRGGGGEGGKERGREGGREGGRKGRRGYSFLVFLLSCDTCDCLWTCNAPDVPVNGLRAVIPYL